MPVSGKVRQQIISQASYRCEYCQTSHRLIGMPPVIDHIIPLALGGDNHVANLAAACYRCNEFKGAKTQASDPSTGQMVSLFHPRHSMGQTKKVGYPFFFIPTGFGGIGVFKCHLVLLERGPGTHPVSEFVPGPPGLKLVNHCPV